MNFAAYVRVSSDKQDTDRQEQAIRATGHPITQWFRDDEGKNPRDQPEKRPAFQAMLKVVEAGLVNVIIVDRQDRFGTKDAYQWGRFIDHLRSHGAELQDASGKVLSADDDVSILTGTLGAITSTREQKEKAHRNLGGKIPKAMQGEYQGGYPPYGTDVVCFGPQGEKWRTMYVGHVQRWKVYPDGAREQFDGKDNTPAKDSHDTMRYRPSLEADRMEWARKVFEWYATESISPGQIADRLRGLGVDPIFGQWNKVKVRALLKNPVYVGIPTYNKRGGSRFVEYVDGQLREVKRTNGKVTLGRPRDKADHVGPVKPEFDPIVPLEIWEKVQRKIEVSSAAADIPRRAPNVSALWLKPFLICGQCGKPMRATRGGTSRQWPSYFCGTYGTYGRDNPTGCRCHRVRHEMVERLVCQYLEEMAPAVRKLLEQVESGNMELVAPMEGLLLELQRLYQGIACDMLHFVDDHATEEEVKAAGSLRAAYGVAHAKVVPQLEALIETKEADLDEMVKGFADITPAARHRVNKLIDAKGEEIEELRRGVIDLQEPFHDLEGELAARRETLDRAVESLKQDVGGRQKAEALSSVIDRIVCHFRHSEPKVGAKNSGKSYLETLEIQPISAEDRNVTMDVEPGPG